MRKIIAALEVSLDGFIEGPNGEIDWIDSWEDLFGFLPQVDTLLLGGGMYPGYEQNWQAIIENPGGVLPLTGKVATRGEIAYAAFASKTPHVVLSRTIAKVAWPNTTIMRNIAEVARMKQQPGKDIHAVGGASLVSSLANAGLIDEIRLIVRPIILGAGKALFAGVARRMPLTLVEAIGMKSGLVRLIYRTSAPSPSNPLASDALPVGHG